MEERFDMMKCPNCSREMHKGVTTKSQRPYLDWHSGRKAPTHRDLWKLPDAEKADDASAGVRFVGTVSGWYLDYRPSWYCHECGLLLIDTKVELER